jgi:hypothetical protein
MNTAQPTKNRIKTVWHRFISSAAWPWIKITILLTGFSLVVNHLATRDSFPGSESYRFPIKGFLSSMALCVFITIISKLNFKFYKKKHFSKKIEITTIVWFFASTLGYITIIYIPIYFILSSVAGKQIAFYYLLISLLLTLLCSFIIIGLAFSRALYNLYKSSIKDSEITIKSGAKITKLSYENIACFYSENKTVYTVQNNGTTINTEFTLNELEEKINNQLFFRANRQIIIHKDAVGQIEKIENGKLCIRLKAAIESDSIVKINISRYKRKAFVNWVQ